MTRIRPFAVSVLLAVAVACASAQQPLTPSRVPAAPATSLPKVTTVILVRHAEKVDNSSDPDLSPAGQERARVLTDVVRRASVTSIITTQFKRTRATAEPTAIAMGITPLVISAGGPAHAKEVADSARARGGVVLVVGHSNTIPAIVAALGAAAPPAICDSEYDDVFIVVLTDNGTAPVTVQTRYGAPSVRGGGCPAMK